MADQFKKLGEAISLSYIGAVSPNIAQRFSPALMFEKWLLWV